MSQKQMSNIAEDIKDILRFYEALGIERLPVKIAQKYKSAVSSATRLGREARKPEFRGPALVSEDMKADTYRPTPKASPVARLATAEKTAALKVLRDEIGDCTRCKLSKERTNIVFGEGNIDAEIMFIGEGPGKEEDLQGRPFVGDAGQLLTKLIEKMGFKREDVYIGNIVKCRPPLNRAPEDDEINACASFIKRQAEIISPKVIIALGRISAQTLIASKILISKLRGRFYEYCGIPLMPTFHPAYLLRNPKDKRLVWEDVQKVLERLK